MFPQDSRRRVEISIHALCEEGDFLQVLDQVITVQFLSTPSARRATAQNKAKAGIEDISIRALRKEGDSRS